MTHHPAGSPRRAVAPPDEEWLVQHAQAGDRQAFARLVDFYWDRLYRWLYRLTHQQHAAEDLTQDTFVKALTNLRSFRAGSNFQAWLFRIAHNAFVNQRREGRRVRLPFPEDVTSPEEGPAEQVLSKEGLQLLARAVGRLPTEYRAAFLLRVEQDLSFAEIAEILQITEETARWRVFKARKKLLATLGAQLERDRA